LQELLGPLEFLVLPEPQELLVPRATREKQALQVFLATKASQVFPVSLELLELPVLRDIRV
jgi:hypothetical protein